MPELVMIGFPEKHRALEVLPQLQRLKFVWCTDLDNAVAVEVERDGRLRLLHSHLLDPSGDWEDASQWKAVLNAIVPLPHTPALSKRNVASEVSSVNADGNGWLKSLSFDQDFVRNAAALLLPGCSAILATLQEWKSALTVLSGYSPFVLHTRILNLEDVPRIS